MIKQFLPIFILTTISVMATQQPNLVIIFTDDQGYSDLGCFGSKKIKTPNIDKMAEEGVKLTSFYAQPICGPSRAALLTGCYPQRCAEIGNKKRLHPKLHPKEILISQQLKEVGYQTACLGKWDLNGHSYTFDRDDIYPENFGFDYWYGLPSSNDNGGINLHRNRKIIAKRTPLNTLTERYTLEALSFIEKSTKKKPYFLYLAHTMPHTKLAVSDKFKGKSADGLYGDVIEEIDASTGRILEKIKQKDKATGRKTVVVFTSDNGPWLVREDDGGCAYPLRDGKTTTFEGGVRVPAVFWGPGVITKGKVSDKLTSTMDIFPTFAKMAGAEVPTDRVIDGHEISALITGKGEETTRNSFYYYLKMHLQAVRNDRWKLILPRPAAAAWCAPIAKASQWKAHDVLKIVDFELYDLKNDISEEKDVAKIYPDVVDELLKLVNKARSDVGDYDKIGKNQRFFDKGKKRADEQRWINR